MTNFCSRIPEQSYREFSDHFYTKAVSERIPLTGTLELTYRCNNSCLHCYCNIKADDQEACKNELNTKECCRIIDQFVDMGCLWLLITGGEVLLRPDFKEIWLYAKSKGMFLSLFTNGTLLTQELADFLQEYPPFSLEITLYGMRRKTYEAVTRNPGSYGKCMTGIHLALNRKLPLKLKAMVLTTNIHELEEMKQFATECGVEFRFDALINTRLDGSQSPCRWRITPEEVIRLDREDAKRFQAFQNFSEKFREPKTPAMGLFSCGAGLTSFCINPYGKMQICGMIPEPGGDLHQSSFADIWHTVFPAIRNMKCSDHTCNACDLHFLCGHCPGWAMAEHNDLDAPVAYLCEVTRLRAGMLNIGGNP